MTWLARAGSLPRAPVAFTGARAATLFQQRLSLSITRWRAMIPQLKQRAVHVQAGLSPVAAEEEEGSSSAGAALHHAAAGLRPSSAAPAPPPPLQPHHPHGSIELVIGPMFAGKTTELLRRVEQQQRRGLSVAVVKSNKDDRYDLSHVVTHDGLKQPCYSVPSLAAFKHVAGPDYASFQVIAIDEAQFFSDLVEFCASAADVDAKHVIVAGLDGDFQRRRFGQILDVVPFADSVTKLTAKCTYCQMEAAAAKAAAAGVNGAAAAAGTAGPNGRRPLQAANGSAAAGAGAGAGAQPNGTAKLAQHAAQQLQHQQQEQEQHAAAAPAPAPRPALFSLRIAADSRQEVVGGADKYAPVCRHHYVRLSQVRSAGAEGSGSEEEQGAAASQ